MIATAPALIRRATTDRIGQFLRRDILPTDPSGAGFVSPTLFPSPSPAPVLPQNPGMPDLPSAGAGYTNNPAWGFLNQSPSQTGFNNLATRLASGGQIAGPVYQSPLPSSGISFGSGGQLQGGYSGPQGTVYGIDPNTGQSIFNVTGSPRPGFFDSPAGKVVETAGSTGLNILAPGLGSVSRWILDAIRNRNTAAHTGTDLSGQNTTSPTAQAPSGPAWYQPGYQPPQGIQNAIARGDYGRAYGPSATSIADLNEMAAQAYGGAPNMPQPDDFGEFGPGRQMGLSRTVRGAPPINTNPASVTAFNNWLMAHKGGG